MNMKNKKEKRCIFCKRIIAIQNKKIPICPRCSGKGMKIGASAGAIGIALAASIGKIHNNKGKS